MPILLTRVDDRLIHGQVVVGWAQSLKANHIIVVSDEVVKNDMQKFLFRMATPTEINLSILGVNEAAEKIRNREFDNDNAIVLAKTPEDFYRMLLAGGKVGEINIGGMHFSENKVQLFDAIFVDDHDVDMMEKINEMNVGLEVRMVPTDSRKDIIKAIRDKYHKKS
jgi:mannose/fructose/N-acetylgalactosamine-specific phosphotransferase system component IIB